MKIKTPTEFQTFNSGLCDIYEVVGNKLAEQPKNVMRFGERVIGYKRYYAARTATTEINRLIHIPLCENVDAHDNVVIDKVRYKVEQIQHLRDTNPSVTVLTLRKVGVVA